MSDRILNTPLRVDITAKMTVKNLCLLYKTEFVHLLLSERYTQKKNYVAARLFGCSESAIVFDNSLSNKLFNSNLPFPVRKI